ncbi:MAG TPA: sugar phosphate isomerase/epimerase family protein [Chloroflexota bacterium]
MKTSFCMMGFGYTQEIAERCIARCGQLGYDGIELWKQYLDVADLGWVRDACAAAGLEIVQLCPYFDFTTSPETYEASLSQAEQFVGYARTLGARWIRTYTGWVGSAEATDEQWQRTVDGLQRICDLGAPHGIEFPLETHQVIHHGPNLTDTSASTLRLLDLVGRPNLRVALQTPLKGETSEYSAEHLGPKVVQIHSHNWIGATATSWGTLTYLDAGDLDFANFLRILRSRGFDGVISIDHPAHSGQHNWEEVAAHEIKYLRGLLD